MQNNFLCDIINPAVQKLICTVCIMERYLACSENPHALRLTSKLVDLRARCAKWICRAELVKPHQCGLHRYDARCCIISMERYRSGHNGADSKSVCGQPHVGSNPTLSVKTKNGQRPFFCFLRKQCDEEPRKSKICKSGREGK